MRFVRSWGRLGMTYKTEWKKNAIIDYIELIGGGTPKTSVPEYWNGKIPWLSVKDFNNDYRYVYATEKHISEKGLVNSSTKLLSRDDIIISARGTVGELAMIPFPMAFNQSCYGIRSRAGIDSTFLYYLLKNSINQLRGMTHGSVFDTITRETFSNLIVDLPDVNTQLAIADILSKLDDKIELNNKINNNLQQQAQTIYVYMFSDNESVASATIADVALNVTDGVHNTVHDDPEGDFLLLSCKNIKDGSLSIGPTERRISKDTFEKLRRRTKLEKGDVLISSVGTIGELLLLNTEPNNYEFQRSVAIVKPNPEIVSSAYLYESFVFQKAELINTAHGAVQQCLFISDIASFPISIPHQEDLQKFNSVVVPMFDIISANEAENQVLTDMRDLLLPQLMSGKFDVSKINF